MAKSPAHKKIIETAMKRWKMCEDAESTPRQKMKDDIEFCDVDDMQWDQPIRNTRKLEGRPCLTINTTQQFVKQVVNDMRQNRPSIHVAPVEDSDEETADIIEGLCRHIEVRSNASVAYDTACTFQVKGGLGFIRVLTEYEDDASFNQEIRIARVKNPFAVFLDPYSVEPDGSDAKFGFVVEDINTEDFKRDFKEKSKNLSDHSFQAKGNDMPAWMNEQTVRIAEYWTVEEDAETIHLMANGSVITAEQYNEFKQAGGTEKPVTTRERIKRTVKWYQITCDEVLDEKEWAGRYIPIVPVIGEENEVNGKRDLVGLVRRMKDPQRMVNYWESAKTEAIALAPKAPFIAAIGQIRGFEEIWATANIKNMSVLPYNPTDIKGQPVPMPQRMQAEAPVQTLVQATEQSYENMKRAAGIYSANLGDRSSEVSGKAIIARQKQGDTANFHFMDNLSRAIQQVGRIIVDLIPHIYDAPRVVRILGVDGSAETVKVNQPSGQKDPQTGMEKVFDLTNGKYDVVVETGPSYNTKREQAAESMVQFVSAYPDAFPLVGDLIAGSMDWPKAQEISERLQKMLPEQLQAKSEQPESPQTIAKMQQAQDVIDQLTAQLNEAKDQLQTKRLDIASKEKISAENNQTKLIIEQLKAEGAANQALFMAQLQNISGQIARAQSKEDAIAQQANPPLDSGVQTPQIPQ